MSGEPRRAKVLLLVTLSEWGGAQYVVYLLAKHLARQYDVSVACAPGGELIPRLLRDGIRTYAVPELVRVPSPWRDLRTLLRLVRLMKQERFAIVHTHSTKAGLLGRLAARMAGVPAVVFTAHGWAFTEGRAWWKRMALALMEGFCGHLLSTKIICVSHHDHDLAVRFHTAPADRLVTIRYGLDPRRFVAAGAPAFRTRLGPRPTPAVGFVGRLAAQKDPVNLLMAFGILAHGTLIMVGDGPLRRRIEGVVRQNALGDRVRLMGSRENIPELLAEWDIFVLPSRWEGLPLVIIEAMMAGLPVVATRVGGVGELVEDGVTGLLVPPADPQALADALQRLLADPGLRRRMGAAGRDRALREFQLDRMVRETSDLYEGLIENAGLRASGRRSVTA